MSTIIERKRNIPAASAFLLFVVAGGFGLAVLSRPAAAQSGASAQKGGKGDMGFPEPRELFGGLRQ